MLDSMSDFSQANFGRNQRSFEGIKAVLKNKGSTSKIKEKRHWKKRKRST
jgi:hypothetical protein